jgi:hypothetical protein
MLIITNLNVSCIGTNIFYNGFYMHEREIIPLVWTYQTWIIGIGTCSWTPPYGTFGHEDLLWDIVIWHIGMRQGPHFDKVAFIPKTWMPNLIVGNEGQDGEWCQFLCKNHIIHLDNVLQQLWVDNPSKFSRFNFLLP